MPRDRTLARRPESDTPIELVGAAQRALQDRGQHDDAAELLARVASNGSDDAVRAIVDEYVMFVDAKDYDALQAAIHSAVDKAGG